MFSAGGDDLESVLTHPFMQQLNNAALSNEQPDFSSLLWHMVSFNYWKMKRIFV